MLKPARWLVVLLFSVAVGAALASRNSSGTYSLPNSPFISGTTISSSVMNSNFSDIGTELTNSLDRNGRGAMAAQLKCIDGTVTAPGLAFASELGSGLYRAGAGDVRLAVTGTQVAKYQANAVTFSQPVTASSTLTASNGATVNQSTVDGVALTVNQNGSGDGIDVGGVGGALGYGIYSTATATNGAGIHGVGHGSGEGVGGVGGSTSGYGGIFNGGSPNGVGVQGTGTGSGVGGSFAAGTASLAAAPQDALALTNGDIKLDGVANPNSNVAIKNRVTPKNIAKAWAQISTDGVGGATIGDGFNLSNTISFGTNSIILTYAQAMGSANCATLVTMNTGTAFGARVQQTSTTATIFPIGGSGTNVDPAANAVSFSLVVFCAQ